MSQDAELTLQHSDNSLTSQAEKAWTRAACLHGEYSNYNAQLIAAVSVVEEGDDLWPCRQWISCGTGRGAEILWWGSASASYWAFRNAALGMSQHVGSKHQVKRSPCRQQAAAMSATVHEVEPECHRVTVRVHTSHSSVKCHNCGTETGNVRVWYRSLIIIFKGLTWITSWFSVALHV